MSQAVEENLNPYTNPNLDADLSITIGKSKASRTKIDAQQFLIKDKSEIINEETTQDRTRSAVTGSASSA